MCIRDRVARLYEISDGSITIDGNDIREFQQRSISTQMGVVLQDPFLFSGSIHENILFGRPDATADDVIASAQIVGAHDFIMQMSDGYSTEVTERGMNLSVGQRQLISFARAILSDPRILILDEATANIDTHTERIIQEALRELLKGRTSLVIAHRLSTVMEADLIHVIDNGRLIESGSHDQLLDNNGTYARLYALQFKDQDFELESRSKAVSKWLEQMATPAIIKKLSRNKTARAVVCWLGTQYIRMVDLTTSWTYGPKISTEHPLKKDIPVSYTHLTLPTSDLV